VVPKSRVIPAPPAPLLPVVVDGPRPGWLARLWQRLLRLLAGR